MNQLNTLLVVAVLLSIASSIGAFRIAPSFTRRATASLQMGLGDMFKKALANDPSLPPAKNPGLNREPEAVEVEFQPSGKKVKAYLGQSISMIAQTAGAGVKYNCKKGDCGTCTVVFNGKSVRACQSFLPSTSTSKKFLITVPDKIKK
jgi:ferredoxin